MRIRENQVNALQSRFAATFAYRLRAFLSERLPEAPGALAGDAGLRRVAAQIALARGLGFRGERDICKFVTLSFLLGERFHEARWAVVVLTSPRHQTPTDRAEALWNAAKQRELDEVVADTVHARR